MLNLHSIKQMISCIYKHYHSFNIYTNIYIYIILTESKASGYIWYWLHKIHRYSVYASLQYNPIFISHVFHTMTPCGTTTCVMYARQHTESPWCRCQGNGQVHTVIQRIPGYSQHFPYNQASNISYVFQWGHIPDNQDLFYHSIKCHSCFNRWACVWRCNLCC